MLREGVLSPAESGEFIAKHSQHVKIHEEGIEKLSLEMLSSISDKLDIPDTGADAIHPSPNHPRAVDWVFVADALNFCFWSKKSQEKWTVEGHSGYYALEAALARALKEDELLPSGSEEEVEIRGCSIHTIELLKKRIEDKLRSSNSTAEVPNSALIDYFLWCYRRKYADQLERIPFHKTLGIFY